MLRWPAGMDRKTAGLGTCSPMFIDWRTRQNTMKQYGHFSPLVSTLTGKCRSNEQDRRALMGSIRPAARFLVALYVTFACLGSQLAWGATITLKDGRVLKGNLAKVASLAENAKGPVAPGMVRPILLVDNGLERTFIATSQVANIDQAAVENIERVKIDQPVADVGPVIGRVGPIVRIKDFDKFGRRIFSMMTEKGQLDVIQGITEITPIYTKVEGLSCSRPYIWDMRIATSSIPRDTLRAVLARQLNAEDLQQRFQLVRLMLQSDRYKEAQEELEAIMKDFPGHKELEPEIRALQQLHSRRLIDEVNMRRAAGQHRLAFMLLQQFPKKNVAGETLQQVREILREYTDMQKQGADLLARLKKDREAIADSAMRARCEAIYNELVQELNINTVDRMAAYMRLADDAQLTPDAHFSLAVSGWLLGSDDANTNLAVSLALVDVRNLVNDYMRTSTVIERDAILSKLKAKEGATLKAVAGMIERMKPPVDSVPANGAAGYYELSIPGIDKDPDIKYLVQLPPEYDPYRRYPTVLTLNGSGTTPAQQLDWWAGALGENSSRLGQATRYGYIVIAIEWAKSDQHSYGYSAREHAAILGCLRDACRRFAIDTDRVFLSGHSMGGDAAWDIGLAHPDLWAGVIPIVAVADKYCARYWENAASVPFYVIGGELDGDKAVRNARDLDRYLLHRFDTTVVEFLGRGHEHFYDEIQRIFDWMGRRKRNFATKSFSATSMRTWDDFFWWLEIKEMPPGAVVEPSDWPPGRGVKPALIRSAKVTPTGSIQITTGINRLRVWLSPELIDFDRPIQVSINGRRLSVQDTLVRPSLPILLEDVRSRADRQHPFWARLEN